MPYRSLEPGKYGMRGMRASALAAQRLDELADGITSPVDTERGLAARLRYLTASGAGYTAMDTAGIAVTPAPSPPGSPRTKPPIGRTCAGSTPPTAICAGATWFAR